MGLFNPISVSSNQPPSSKSAFRVYSEGVQFVNTINEWAKINFDLKAFDSLNEFENGAFIAQQSGLYLFSSAVLVHPEPASPFSGLISIHVDGIENSRGIWINTNVPSTVASTYYTSLTISALVLLEKNQDADIRVYLTQNCNVLGNSSSNYFCGTKVG